MPTLHEVLQSAFLSVSSGLLTIGAICSAVFKKNGLYAFFDSHSHGENGLSSSDGASSLITFSNLNDLVTYLYAFYDSMKLDTYLQFDFLPMNVRKCEDKQSYKDEMASHMEAYFNDQRLKQAMKTQSYVRSIPYDLSSVSIKDSKKPSGAKRKKLRIEYYKNYRRQSRQNPVFKAKERESKRSARKDALFKSKEIMYQKESKQSARKNPAFKTKERESKQLERMNPVFRAKETVYQRESKQSKRKNPVFRTKERESKQSERRNPVFRAKERESKQSERRNPVFRTKERESKQSERRNPVFRTKERESKQSERRNPVFRTKERESKQSERRNPVFRTKETAYQRKSKQSTRKDPAFKAKEIVYQRKSKQLARENQAFIEKEKVFQNMHQKKGQGKIRMFLNVRELGSNK